MVFHSGVSAGSAAGPARDTLKLKGSASYLNLYLCVSTLEFVSARSKAHTAVNFVAVANSCAT